MLFVASLATAGGMVTSCSGVDDQFVGFVGSEPSDASPDGPEIDQDDAGASDASHAPRDAGRDGRAHSVSCETSPCATSLTTTLGRNEGYCALLDDGTVACWGQNAEGQLGRGEDAGTLESQTPARVLDLSNVVRLAHTCAIDVDRAAWCWVS